MENYFHGIHERSSIGTILIINFKRFAFVLPYENTFLEYTEKIIFTNKCKRHKSLSIEKRSFIETRRLEIDRQMS